MLKEQQQQQEQEQQEQLWKRITQKVIEMVHPEFIESTKTDKGNTQKSERLVIDKVKQVLNLLEISYTEAGSQQSKDFRNVGGIGLNIEIKKTDNPVVIFNDTCPTKDIYYIIFFTGKRYKRTSENDIPPQLICKNGAVFLEGSDPWLPEFKKLHTLLLDMYGRGENKKKLPGILEVYPRPTYKANIKEFLTKAEAEVEVLDPLKDEDEQDVECRYVKCDECESQIDCYNDNINIIYKGES